MKTVGGSDRVNCHMGEETQLAVGGPAGSNQTQSSQRLMGVGGSWAYIRQTQLILLGKSTLGRVWKDSWEHGDF